MLIKVIPGIVPFGKEKRILELSVVQVGLALSRSQSSFLGVFEPARASLTAWRASGNGPSTCKMAAKRLCISWCSSRLIVLLVWLTVGLTGVLQPGEAGVSLPGPCFNQSSGLSSWA